MQCFKQGEQLLNDPVILTTKNKKMNNETITSPSKQQTFIYMIISAWQAQNKRLNDLLDKLSDEQLSKDTAPGRNSGTYLIGHLAAVNDGMLPILGFGEKLHPELENIFIKSPDKSGPEKPSITQLKECWNEINAKLTRHMENMHPDEWFERHTSVSAEDFAKEPHRNKLNILATRTVHQSYHLGQLAYLG